MQRAQRAVPIFHCLYKRGSRHCFGGTAQTRAPTRLVECMRRLQHHQPVGKTGVVGTVQGGCVARCKGDRRRRPHIQGVPAGERQARRGRRGEAGRQAGRQARKQAGRQAGRCGEAGRRAGRVGGPPRVSPRRVQLHAGARDVEAYRLVAVQRLLEGHAGLGALQWSRRYGGDGELVGNVGPGAFMWCRQRSTRSPYDCPLEENGVFCQNQRQLAWTRSSSARSPMPIKRMQWCRRPGPSRPWAISKPRPSPARR